MSVGRSRTRLIGVGLVSRGHATLELAVSVGLSVGRSVTFFKVL